MFALHAASGAPGTCVVRDPNLRRRGRLVKKERDDARKCAVFAVLRDSVLDFHEREPARDDE